MGEAPKGPHTRQLADAFNAFEEGLRLVFAAEARQAVEAAAARMAAGDGTFRIADIQIDVVISSLTVESGAGKPTTPKRRPTRSASRSGAPGRPPGALRSAIVDAFADDRAQLTIDDIRTHLERAKLRASTDNLHQHLRRLVKAGELERSGRGLYRRARSAAV
jgi:hypothetical protein